ncbi:MAG: HTTM domain-containing protein [Planctomycetaceae bacterium]|nr:HTTM domain-containing protein [Planctomycetales bacterium]MCB9927307.1 HTTM domain-containing protein [Planctomycetaceae bacterium]
MNLLSQAVKRWCAETIAEWNRFWFTPSEPHTLGLLRILAGAMLLYTHLVWSKDLIAFLGPNSWIPREASMELHQGTYAWSHLWYFDSPVLLWAQHIVVLVVMLMFTVGLFTRVTSVLACLFTISYCHRLEGALFGLDQVNAMLSMYLMIGPCGAVYSVDRWLARRKSAKDLPRPAATTNGNISMRLIQVHMCIIYLFGGISKLRGDMWWDGTAVWYAISNLEYQSLDMTWLVRYPWFIALLSHITVFWETFYCFLVWPRITRPIALGLAFCVHGGIALFLGMITFGTAMIIGNMAFLPPSLVESAIGRLAGQTNRVSSVAIPADLQRRRNRRSA